MHVNEAYIALIKSLCTPVLVPIVSPHQCVLFVWKKHKIFTPEMRWYLSN